MSASVGLDSRCEYENTIYWRASSLLCRPAPGRGGSASSDWRDTAKDTASEPLRWAENAEAEQGRRDGPFDCVLAEEEEGQVLFVVEIGER